MSASSDDELNTIVLDNGSSSIKTGFAGDEAPLSIMPNILGYLRHPSIASDTTQKESFIGNKALAYRNILNLRYPMERGIVTNWNDMEMIWHYIFKHELHLSSKDSPLLITEAPLNPIGNREKMTQILFEHFQVPAMYVANQGILSLYSLGRLTCIILGSGDGVSYSQVVWEGHVMPHSGNCLGLTGRDLTDYLSRLLAERGYSFTTTAEREIVRDIKEKLAYVAVDFEKELVTTNQSKGGDIVYKLPDGQQIMIGNERFRCAEALFRPTLIGQQELGIVEILHDTIMKCDVDMRLDLYCNILLSGGTTMLPGFAERVKKDMGTLIPTGRRLRVVAAPERKCAAWLGGSVLASLSTFQQMWISKQDYDEFGPSIVHRKCIKCL